MKKIFIVLLVTFAFAKAHSQGPPLTADKPIMLGGGSFIAKTLTEIRVSEDGTATRVPLMLHYLPTSNTLVAVHLPYVTYDYDDFRGSGSTLGDINIVGKYQFYRKDGTGKTFRMVAKTLQTLPTGEALDIEGISTGKYSGYYGVVAGYESLKYGISNEAGYSWMPDGSLDKLVYKLGFGLPLLKPTYPVNQLNLYFEYSSEWFLERDQFELLYAQGIQYARKQWTWEAGVQIPLSQNVPEEIERKYSIYLGTRFIL
ncbi:hypothetical protein [uncultured Dokdonia sp.]|uniref:hypothetical protein n=1 Tax=uncultured Dokdonia sp. TaxID=575653 RepID=UPI0030EEE24B|tara:strand:- start:33239 stop:34009 length:771 start_codon:yes stop_codon:yes gene_type:complete